MSRVWQLQEAKSKFSKVVEEAIARGPQVITRRGVETAVVLSYDDYRSLLLKRKSLSTFFRESPLVGEDLDLTRDQSGPRDEIDSLIAASVLAGEFTLVTRNEDGFKNAGIPIVNPWKLP